MATSLMAGESPLPALMIHLVPSYNRVTVTLCEISSVEARLQAFHRAECPPG